jgi:DNA-binding beta-propeller fold protein YncE
MSLELWGAKRRNQAWRSVLLDRWPRRAHAGGCAKARVLDDPIALAVSPDGRSLYTAPGLGNTISVFDRR